MLKRKISAYLESHLTSGSDQILMIQGARQIGKSYAIREVGKRLFPNYIEINFVTDDEGPRQFKSIRTVEEFYFVLSSIAGEQLGNYDNTLIFLDEIQRYPQYFTLLKFFRQDHKYRFITSGSALGIALRKTGSIPVGSVIPKKMYQLDFEEFLWANNYGSTAIAEVRKHFEQKQTLSIEQHNYILNLFIRYLLVGGLPDVVNVYLSTHNITKVRELQEAISELYKQDAAQYEQDSGKRLLIQRIYGLVLSQMENKKKRIVFQDIQEQKGDRYSRYESEFEYLLASAITLGVNAVSNPHYPLSESLHKNLIKLYLNDVGMLTGKLYGNNIQPLLQYERSINLGAVYESVVAQELAAHGFSLFYYDNRSKGEVDYIIDDVEHCSVMPIEVKSGRDYTIHSALNNMIRNPDYGIQRALVLSNNNVVKEDGSVLYMPIYYIMFIEKSAAEDKEDMIF